MSNKDDNLQKALKLGGDALIELVQYGVSYLSENIENESKKKSKKKLTKD